MKGLGRLRKGSIVVWALIGLLLLSTGCIVLPPVTPTPADSGTGTDNSPNDGGVTPEPEAPDLSPAEGRAYEAARDVLAERLGSDVSDIRLVGISPEDWPDACLGLAEPGEMCAQVITPGYRITLEANGMEYQCRSDAEATVVRCED